MAKHGKDDELRIDAGQARGVGVRPRGVDGASSGEIAQRPRELRGDDGRGGDGHQIARRLREAEPMEAGRQILYPGALRDPTKPIA